MAGVSVPLRAHEWHAIHSFLAGIHPNQLCADLRTESEEMMLLTENSTKHIRLLTALLMFRTCIGCGSGDTSAGPNADMVYVDTETFVAVVAPRSGTVPTINPATGQRTLMPGLYCQVCKKWYPVPSPEQINRQNGAALCPKTKTPMIADGPWPENTPTSGDSK